MSQALQIVKARVSGERDHIDFESIKHEALNDEDNGFAFKIGQTEFELYDVDNAKPGLIKVNMHAMNKNVCWKLVISYVGKDSKVKDVACHASVPGIRDQPQPVMLKASQATSSAITRIFLELDKKIRDLGFMDFTKPSFKLGRYTMLLKKGRSNPLYISKEVIDGEPFVILDFTSSRRINEFSIVESFDGGGPGIASYVDLVDPKDSVGQHWARVFDKSNPISSPLEFAKFVESKPELLQLVNNPAAKSPIDERGMLLNVKQGHVLFDQHKRNVERVDRDSFDDESDAFLMFPNKEKLKSALDAIRVAVTTNGGRIVTKHNGALRV